MHKGQLQISFEELLPSLQVYSKISLSHELMTISRKYTAFEIYGFVRHSLGKSIGFSKWHATFPSASINSYVHKKVCRLQVLLNIALIKTRNNILNILKELIWIIFGVESPDRHKKRNNIH